MEEISSSKIQSIVKIADRWLSYQQFMREIPGLSAGIVYKNKIIFNKSYGYADVENKIRMPRDALYRIASISKLFTGVAIMQLVETEKVGLDDLTSKYLPEVKEKMTIRQLLTHSSGIERDGNTHHWTEDKFPDFESVKSQLKEGIKVSDSNRKFKYSNLGYTLLGKIIEKASGSSYAKYIEDNIIKKLGLKNTHVDFIDELEGKMAKGYGRKIPNIRREIFKNVSTNVMASATGLVSNVQDLCTFLSANFLDNDLLLEKESKIEMQRAHWVEESKENLKWGLGFEMWKSAGNLIRGHGGGFSGFITVVGFDREKDLGVVILTNSIDGMARWISDGVFHITNYILNNWEGFKPIPNKSLDLSKFEGRFSERWCDVEVVEINGSLNYFTPVGNAPLEGLGKLEYINDTTFKIQTKENFDYDSEKAAFSFDKAGKINKVKFGPSVLIPHEDYLAKLKSSKNL